MDNRLNLTSRPAAVHASHSYHPTPLVRVVAALLGTQLLGRTIRIFYIITVARVVGPEAAGIFLYGMSLHLCLALIAAFSQEAFLSTRLNKRPSATETILSHSLFLSSIAILIATAAGLLFVILTEGDHGSRTAALLFVAAVIPRGLVTWVRGWGVASENAAWIPRFEAVFRGGEAVVGTILLASGFGVLTLCALHLATWAAEACFSFRIFGRHTPIRIWRLPRARILCVVGRASALMTLALSSTLMFPQISVFAVKFDGADDPSIGYVGLIAQLFTVLLVPAFILGTAIVPALGRVRRRVDGFEETMRLAIIMKAALLGGALAGLFLLAYGAVLIDAAFGAAYMPLIGILDWVVWAIGPYAVVVVTVYALLALVGPRAAALLAIGTSTVQIAVYLLLHEYLEPMNAAGAAILAASGLGCLASLEYMRGRISLGCQGWPFVMLGTLSALTLVGAAPAGVAVWIAPSVLLIVTIIVSRSNFFTKDEIIFLRTRILQKAFS